MVRRFFRNVARLRIPCWTGLRVAVARAAQQTWSVAREPRRRCVLLTLTGLVTFLVGLTLPFVHVAPGERLGSVTGVIVGLFTAADTYTLYRSLLAIWDDYRVLGGLAFMFSLGLPSVKWLLLFSWAWWEPRDGRRAALCRTWVERIGPWSMLEVFLVALTLLATRSLPLGTAIHLLPGFYCFWASIILSLLATWSFPRRHFRVDHGRAQASSRDGTSDDPMACGPDH